MKKGTKVWCFIAFLTVVGLMFSGLIDTSSATQEKTTVSVTDSSPWFTNGTNSGRGPWFPHPKEDPDYISTYVGGMSWLGLGDSPLDPDCWARFKPYLSQPGEYEVYAYFYACKDTSKKVPFTVKYGGGSRTIKVNQYSSTPAWKEKSLGTWYFEAGQDTYVNVTDATGEDYDPPKGLTIGAIKFVKVIEESFNVAVILAEPSDVTHESSAIVANPPCKLFPKRSYLNGHDKKYYEDIAYCVADYHKENSFGIIALNFIVYDNNGEWFKLDNPMSNYLNGDEKKFLVEAIDKATEKGFVLSDKDIILAIHPGSSRQKQSDTKHFLTTCIVADIDIDKNRAVLPPTIIVAEDDLVGAWAHEIGHALGALSTYTKNTYVPDLNKMGNLRKILLRNPGAWALMGHGSWNDDGVNPPYMTSFVKEFLGWLEYKEIGIGSYWIESLDTSKYGDKIYMYKINDDEYYILEVRENSGDYGNSWDTSAPETALILYLVDTKGLVESKYGYNLNTEMMLIQEDWTINIPPKAGREDAPFTWWNDGVLSPEGEEYWDLDNLLSFATVDVEASPPKSYRIKTDIQKLDARDFKKSFRGIILKAENSLQQRIQKFFGWLTPPNAPMSWPDLDLHAYTNDGRHIGVNYETDEYEIEVLGAIASGDMLNAHEWIFLPEELNNKVHYVVSSKDTQKFFSDFPEINQQVENKTDSYEVYARYIDPSTGIYTSNSLSEDIKPGVDLEHTLTGTTDISVSPAFPYNQLQIGVVYVPDDYPSIQAAVDAANAGDTIIVRYGTYTENVDIDKSITLKSSSGNPGNTIVQAANPNDHVFEITADYVNIRGFTVGGVAVCIFLNEVNYCNISNNHILNYTGIYLNYSNDNIIMNNNFSKSDDGILLDSSNSNTVFNNTFSGYNLYSLGIGLKNSTNNLISDNTICNCPHGGIELGFASSNNIISNNTFKSCGLCVWRYEKNTVEGNTVNDKPLIYLENVSQIVVDNAGQVILANCELIKVIGCNLSNATIGIDLLNSSNCVIENNICRDNFCGGIDLFDYSSNNIVLNNIIGNNFWGIFLTSYASNNEIVNNICENNYFGIHLSDTNNNRIYLNNLNNDCNVQSYDSCNIWNSKEKITYTYNGESHTKYLGNYWSDYTGTDANKNGIGDSPYSIDDRGGDIDQDYYPLMTWSEHYFNPPPHPHPLPMPPPTSTLTPSPRPTLTLVPRPTPTLVPRPTPTLVPRPTPTLAPRPTPTLAPRPTLRPTATLFEKIEGLIAAIRVGVGI